MNQINILLVSSLCSEAKYLEVRKNRYKQSLDPARRLFDALTKGLNEQHVKMTCITALPYSKNNTDLTEVSRESEIIDNISYVYLGFRMSQFHRMFDLYKNSQEEFNIWEKSTRNSVRYVICDSLVLMCSNPIRRAAQKSKVPVVAFVTDYPSLATSIKGQQSLYKKIFSNIFDKYADNDLRKYDGYILVADPLKELIGKSCSNYVVVEDLVTISDRPPIIIKKNKSKKSIVYGGALCKRFGIDMLVDAFKYIKNDNIHIYFYGSGESQQYIQNAAKKDPRIHFCGTVMFNEMLCIESDADLLINPRPTNEEFAKYSFPSKTLSYMLSGTPVLSTRIPGIPKEYNDYLFWFDVESPESFAAKIQEVLNLPSDYLFDMGEKAYNFVKSYKNSTFQSQKVINFLKKLSL